MWPIKKFQNISWSINIYLKFFMVPAKTLRLPPTYLIYGPLMSSLVNGIKSEETLNIHSFEASFFVQWKFKYWISSVTFATFADNTKNVRIGANKKILQFEINVCCIKQTHLFIHNTPILYLLKTTLNEWYWKQLYLHLHVFRPRNIT